MAQPENACRTAETELQRRRVMVLLDFQYGYPVGKIIADHATEFQLSLRTGRLKAVSHCGLLLAVSRQDGYLLLQKGALSLLKQTLLRRSLSVDEVAVPFILKGSDLFAKHLKAYAGEFSVGEDVIMIDGHGQPIGCGEITLLPSEAKFFKRGRLVKTRFGVGSPL